MTPELARYPEEALGQLRAALDLEALVLAPKEFQERRDLPFLQGVLREAKPLYERGKAPA